ncbi:MAG: hypothetical protein AAGA80_05325 [Cyanobacteria bacterium P01_F01_bin.143]
MDKNNPLIYLLGATGCLLLALHSKQTNTGAMAASLGGAVLAQTAMAKASERFIDDEVNVILRNAEVAKYELIAQSELAALLPQNQYPEPEIIDVQATETLPHQSKKGKYYNLKNLPNEGNGVLVGAGPGYGKTSMVAGYFVPLYTQKSPAEIIVLDPDSNVNRWDKWGYERAVNDYDEILKCLQWFVSEKERRKKLKDYELFDQHDLILIWDEINDCRRNWTKKEQDEAARCLGILLNSRKYKITVFAMMQDANVEAIGISKKCKDQAVIILSGKASLDEAKTNGVKTSYSRYIELDKTGYPCVVTGALSFQLAIHPTHGHYPEYERTGKPPANVMKPILSDKQIIPFARVSVNNSEQKETDNGNNIIQTETGRFDLNKEDEVEGSDSEGEGSDEPAQNPDALKLEDILSKGYSDLEPSALIPDGWSPADPLAPELPAKVRGVLRDLISIKCTKKETIELVFNAKKGGGNKYVKASEWYDKIKAQINYRSEQNDH